MGHRIIITVGHEELQRELIQRIFLLKIRIMEQEDGLK